MFTWFQTSYFIIKVSNKIDMGYFQESRNKELKYPLLTHQWLKALRNIHTCYGYKKGLSQQKLLVLF